jgi:hypothetical protein
LIPAPTGALKGDKIARLPPLFKSVLKLNAFLILTVFLSTVLLDGFSNCNFDFWLS